ncbi:ABC transporter permease [Microbacterium hominis]|uniref:YhgE/Pip family protein n=1 Tax=Microbacterium TaxID=33882 RepID=UPI00168C0789|nr:MULTISPECIES: YhgE/Pip family protein [Microbacterium]QOC26720.1 ABC transporter permease [Microbacterium hominis]QOC27897.1 ABC transporter permease [Microbacterium hominis]QYF96952.1 YhgE/Pip family protein [Microbacterium sp. PAMC21962]
MKIPAMIAAELRRLTATRMSVLALVALMLVPVLYGGLYLWANQDPYGHFSEVPVALVDLDEGSGSGADAAQYGSQVSQQLIDGHAFDWRALSEADAATALHDGTVDFIVTIPSDFSAALVSSGGSAPRQATIGLQTNDANNYLASTIGTQAVEKIRRSVAELVGQEAASRLLTGLSDIRAQLVQATDGATTLTDGAQQVADGSTTLAQGTATLATGAATLTGGATQVADGAAQVADGAAQVADGTATLDGYADRAAAAGQDVVDSLPQARADIAALLAQQGVDQATIDRVLASLDPVGDAARTGNARLQSAVAQVDRLAAGAAQVASGAAQVSSGAAQVASGAGALTDGANQAATGAATLSSGAGQVASGAAQLRDGLASGVQAIPDTDAATRDAQAKVISDPVAVDSSAQTSAGDYGAGLAPFFAALAGWIGIYALFLIVKPISRRAVTALRSPIRVTIAGWLTPALLGSVGMVALFAVLSFTLGFRFANPLGTLGILMLASFTYAAIILALNVWLGSVGQFVGLVMMVLQLVTAGGTFPWQTLPAPLATLHHILPMGYVVDAMRQLMYGGDLARVSTDIGVLLLWLGGALALSAVGVTRMTHRRTLRDLQPSLIG